LNEVKYSGNNAYVYHIPQYGPWFDGNHFYIGRDDMPDEVSSDIWDGDLCNYDLLNYYIIKDEKEIEDEVKEDIEDED
jgi:hypothetical protein